VDAAWFEEVLYPLQDEVLAAAAPADTGFYLTGGTAGVFAADVARVLLGATAEDWRLVRWIPPAPAPEEFVGELRALGEGLLLLR
jgi:hypothetical protein